VALVNIADLYEEHVDFVWRMATRLGVPAAQLEDAVQEVFLVLHRRREEFRHASSVRTWIGGIVVRVAQDVRRSGARHVKKLNELELVPTPEARDPHDAAEDAQSLARALRLLEQLDEDQRIVFVLTELEELSAREIAEIIGSNPNTVASRLRLARRHFDALVAAEQAKERAS
jgi:RNA polymerase sigma-70 factor, ECF subfamily